MRAEFRVYGHIAAASESIISQIAQIVADYEITRQADGSLDFVHEGLWRDVESDLHAIREVLGTTGRGVVDVIDHAEWRMTRYFLENGAIRAVPIHLDHALDTAYRSETGVDHA
ncbi:MAG: hypothetical protein JG774_723 [Desulfomicrobiaceae bacterium]|nr:hypothetical protein [Desulfomicrobiaceae bacterium]MBZ4684978.1 hypothetical protein [Desulfomicrobiaceae bacterium]MDI3493828.1 hypothetical protein [Desulfomicrobiaceae bacterium]HCF05445.1 hypothetical protein [Desulfomicrobiaceae bacterium]